MNNNRKSGYLCHVSNLREIASSFSTLIMMLAVSLSYIAFIMFRYVPAVSAGEFLSLIDGEFYQKHFLLILR